MTTIQSVTSPSTVSVKVATSTLSQSVETLWDKGRQEITEPCGSEAAFFQRTFTQPTFPKLARMYDTVKELDGAYGGKLYALRINPVYKNKANFDAMQKEIFPGVEPDENEIQALAKMIEEAPELEVLGYGVIEIDGHLCIVLPDDVALKAGFEELRKTRPELRPLVIVSSEGIATDIDFARARFIALVLLALRVEFLHDHFAHLIPTFIALFEDAKSYYSNREQEDELLASMDIRLELFRQEIDKGSTEFSLGEIERLQLVLGITTDGVWGAEQLALEHIAEKPYKVIDAITSDQSYRDYWAKRLDGEVLNEEALVALWDKFICERE